MAWAKRIEELFRETQPYLDYLASYDYDAQRAVTQKMVKSLQLPLDASRFTLRPMTPADLPAAAHLLAHTFSEDGIFGAAVGWQSSPAVSTWILRLRIALCDHFSFVVEDQGEEGKENNWGYDNCTCAQHIAEDLAQPANIVAVIVAHDFASTIFSLKLPDPPRYRMRAIRECLNKLDDARIARIREEDNLLLTREEIQEREEKEKSGEHKQVHPERPHHYTFKRDARRDNARTLPQPGEGLEVWLLATRRSHTRHRLAFCLSRFLEAYVSR
jgi:hypothetical protein